MSAQPLFTIAIPVIKTKFLASTISSVLKQTFRNFELVILNDASPENVEKVLLKFTDQRIKYFTNIHNLGAEHPTRAWNKTLSLAKGKYFLLLGDDDLLAPHFLKDIAMMIKKYPGASLFRGQLAVVDGKDTILYFGVKPPEVETWDEHVYYRFKYLRPQATCEHVAKTTDLKKIGGFFELPLAWGSDDATWIRLALHGGIISSPTACAYWRNSDYNISSMPYQDKKNLAIKRLCALVRSFIQKHPTYKIPKKLLLAAVTDREKSHLYNYRSALVNYF